MTDPADQDRRKQLPKGRTVEEVSADCSRHVADVPSRPDSLFASPADPRLTPLGQHRRWHGQWHLNQFGVGDPNTPGQSTPDNEDTGSDKQAQDFQAAFQQEQGVINGHLQYTAVNAEAARHDPLAARRDAMYTAFQSALAKIDRKNPSKAQADIDKVLGDARALSGEVATFRQESERAKSDWDSRQGKYDDTVRQVEELEAWEDAKAPALRGLVDGIRTHVNQRQYAQASNTLDQLLPKLAPIYEEYLRQKEAKPQYEQQLAEQSARLDPLKAADRPSQPMTAKAGEADAALAQARAKGEGRDFVSGLEQMDRAHDRR